MPDVFGHKVSAPALTAIIGGSGLAIWFAVRQHKDSASSTTASASAIDPVTGLPYSQDDQIDPLTGEAYLAEAQEYGSVAAAEQAVAGESADDLTSAGNAGLAGTSAGVTGDVQGTGYASNAQWAQAVTAGLGDLGYSSTDVAAALGMYLGSLPLSTLADGVSAVSIVQAALAEYGPPPVGTFTIIMPTTTTTTAAGGTGTATGTPVTTGTTGSTGTTTTTGSASWAYPAPDGLKVIQQAGTGVKVSWDPVTGPQGQKPSTYTVATFNSGGTRVDEFNSGATTTEEFGSGGKGLPKGAYHLEVWANGGPVAPPHATVDFTLTA